MDVIEPRDAGSADGPGRPRGLRRRWVVSAGWTRFHLVTDDLVDVLREGSPEMELPYGGRW